MVDGERFAEGREAEVFLRPDGTVLKLWRDAAYAWRVEREAAALTVLAKAGVAAPVLVEVVTVHGRPGLVMNRIAGDNLVARLGRRPLSVLKAGTAMARAHAAVHEVIAPTRLPALRDELRARIETAEPLTEALRLAALTALDELPDGDRLCHGDLHLGNLLGEWQSPSAIDWGDAARGDPVADVAHTELLTRLGSAPPGAPLPIRVLAPIGRDILAAQYLAAYRRARPVDGTALNKWRIVQAAARLREPIPSEHPRFLRYLRRHTR